VAKGVADEFDGGSEFQFAQEMGAMGIDGFNADPHLPSDLLARFSRDQEPQDFDLARGELFDFAVVLGDLLVELGNRAGTKSVMAPERFERGDQLLGRLALKQAAPRVRPENLDDVMVRLRAAEKTDGKKVRDGEAPSPAREARALPGSGNERVGQKLGHVFRMSGREVFQLMAATGSGSDDDAVGRLGADLLHEGRASVFRYCKL
jgi:hypothetical protein